MEGESSILLENGVTENSLTHPREEPAEDDEYEPLGAVRNSAYHNYWQSDEGKHTMEY